MTEPHVGYCATSPAPGCRGERFEPPRGVAGLHHYRSRRTCRGAFESHCAARRQLTALGRQLSVACAMLTGLSTAAFKISKYKGGTSNVLV